MQNYKPIDISTWKRKAQFEFFKTFESPHFNVTANVNVGPLRAQCKAEGKSFFMSCVYMALQTANEIDEFRYRISGDEVWDFETIQAGLTILQEDETFIYTTLDYQKDLSSFLTKGKEAIEEQKRTRGFSPHNRLDMVFFSILPWVSFTSIQHAMNLSPTVYIPRIVFGKYFEEGEHLKMPVAVQVHHALADGFHVGKFYQLLQKKIDALRD